MGIESVMLPILHQLVKILLHVLEDEVQHVVLPYHLFQLHHVRVAELLQRLRQNTLILNSVLLKGRLLKIKK